MTDQKIRCYFFLFVALSLTNLLAQGQKYAVKNVSVIPMDREVVFASQTVLIVNGKIARLGDVSKIDVPAGYTTIDGSGKYLLPGFFDMHTHFFYEQGENVNTCETELKMMLLNGLTTARIQCGDSVYLDARQNLKNGKWIGPELYVSSPQFVGSWPWPGKVFAEVCTTAEEAEQAVKKCKQQGYDEIKITFMIKRPVYDAIIKTAKDVGIKVTGHVGPLVKLPAALAAREQIEHMDEFIDLLLPDTSYNHGQSVSDMNIWRKNAWATVPYLDENKLPALVKAVKDAGIYVTPTNYFFLSCFGDGMTDDKYKEKPDYKFIPAKILAERWDIKERYWKNRAPEESRKRYSYLRKKMTLELWKAGVKLMAGSDSPEWFLAQGFAIHDEIETFVKAGMTPFAALQTATINPATYLGINNRTGTITAGREADLILLDKNPLDDIRNTRSISGVFNGTKWYDATALENLKNDIKVLAN